MVLARLAPPSAPGPRPGLPPAARLRPRTGHGPHGRAARAWRTSRRRPGTDHGRRRPRPVPGPHPAVPSAGPPGPVRTRRRGDGRLRGPYTVVVVDGDPGGADVREAVARLALEGPRAGIHVVCLAETASASPASPVTETYEAACAVAPAFRECGAVALLSGDVATALRLMRVARTGSGTPVAPGSGPAGRAPRAEERGGPADPPAPTETHTMPRPTPAARAATTPAPPTSGHSRALPAHRPHGPRHRRRRGRRLPRLGRAVRAGARPAADRRRRDRAARARLGAVAPSGAAAGRVGAGPGHPGVADGALGGRGGRHRRRSAAGPGPCSVPVRAARSARTSRPTARICWSRALRAAGVRSCCGPWSPRWPRPSAPTGWASS